MDQTQEPIKIHHQPSEEEEEEHHESGATKMFRKVKAKAKKVKNSLTNHGQSHEHDHDVVEEDDEDDELEPEAIGAPHNTRSGVRSQPESLNHPREAIVREPEEIIPPGIKVFPELEVELGGGFPTRSRESGLKTESGIGKDSLTYSSESETGLQEKISTRSDDVKVETELRRDLPTGSHDQFSPELSRPKKIDDFEETKDETTQKTKPNTYTEQIASATSAIINKAIAAKDAVASKLGYSGASGVESRVVGETPSSATGYGKKVVGTVVENLTAVYEKVKDTGSIVITKLPLSGGGNLEETQQRQDKAVSVRDYLSEKLKPGEEDKALSEVIAEKLHFGRWEKNTTMTKKEMEVTVEKIPTDEILGENEDVLKKEVNVRGGERGIVGKVKGAVTSWIGGTKPKSHDSGEEESSQSLGSTVGTMGFKDTSGGSEAVQVQRGLDN